VLRSILAAALMTLAVLDATGANAQVSQDDRAVPAGVGRPFLTLTVGASLDTAFGEGASWQPLVGIGGGFFLTPKWSLSAEFEGTGHDRWAYEYTCAQPSCAFAASRDHNERNHLTTSVLLGYRPRTTGRIRPAFLFGAGVVILDAVRVYEVQARPGAQYLGGQGPDTQGSWLETGGSLSGGIDLPLSVGRRVTLVPRLRVHQVFGADPGFIIRPAVDLRIGSPLSQVATNQGPAPAWHAFGLATVGVSAVGRGGDSGLGAHVSPGGAVGLRRSRFGVEVEGHSVPGLTAAPAACGLANCTGSARSGLLRADVMSANALFFLSGDPGRQFYLSGGLGALWSKEVTSMTIGLPGGAYMSEIAYDETGLAISVGAGLHLVLARHIIVRPEARLYSSVAMSRSNLGLFRASIASGYEW